MFYDLSREVIVLMIILLSITVVSLHFQECIKPVFSDTERDKTAIKQTLFDCVDTFLRAASPFMPYLTEELYQRLHICNEQRPESICVARYPTPEEVNTVQPALKSTSI
jgi:valyl-tRNA synthetase